MHAKCLCITAFERRAQIATDVIDEIQNPYQTLMDSGICAFLSAECRPPPMPFMKYKLFAKCLWIKAFVHSAALSADRHR